MYVLMFLKRRCFLLGNVSTEEVISLFVCDWYVITMFPPLKLFTYTLVSGADMMGVNPHIGQGVSIGDVTSGKRDKQVPYMVYHNAKEQ